MFSLDPIHLKSLENILVCVMWFVCTIPSSRVDSVSLIHRAKLTATKAGNRPTCLSVLTYEQN